MSTFKTVVERMCDVAEARKLPMIPMDGHEGYLVSWQDIKGCWVLQYQGGEATEQELLRAN